MGWTQQHTQYWELHKKIFETNPFSQTPKLGLEDVKYYRKAENKKRVLDKLAALLAPFSQGRDPVADAHKLTYVGGVVKTNVWPKESALVNIVPSYAMTAWTFKRIAELGVPRELHTLLSGYRHPAADVVQAGRDSQGGLVGGDGGHTSFTAIDRGLTSKATGKQIRIFTMACIASVAALERWMTAHQVVAPHGDMGGVRIKATSTPCIGLGLYRSGGQCSRTHLDVFHRSRRKPAIRAYRTWLSYPISNALDAFKDEGWAGKLGMDQLPTEVVDALKLTIRMRGLAAAL